MGKLLKKMLFVYWLLFCILAPIAFVMIPLFLALFLANGYYCYLFILTIPIGAVLMDVTWDPKFIGEISDKFKH
jgi:hypothetical protein